MLLLLGAASMAFASQGLLEAQEENNDDAAGEQTAALVERAHEFRDAYAEADTDALWDLLNEESQLGMDADLSELKRSLRELPEDQRNDELPGLSVSANFLLDLRSGRDYFAWLVSEIDDEHLEMVGTLSVDPERITFRSDDQARLRWQAPEDADRMTRNLAREMPQTAVLENDRWHLVVTAD